MTKILKLNDKVYKLAEMEEKETTILLEWAKKQLPDPLAEIKPLMDGFSPKIQETMIREAMTQRRVMRTLDHPEIQAVLKTPAGQEQVMIAIFKKHQPDLTIEQIWEVHRQAVKELGENFVEKLSDE